MIRVNVLLVRDEKSSVHRGRIDPGGTFESLKTDILRSLQLEHPEDFTIAFAPRDEKRHFDGSYELQDGDTIVLMATQNMRPPSFVLEDNDQ